MNDAESRAVSYYGLHETENGVMYLHQGNGSANFIGLQQKSPYTVKNRKSCPHMINILAPRPDRIHWEYFMQIFGDDLVQEMLPIPKKPLSSIPFIGDDNGKLSRVLISLSRMSSPNYSLIASMSSALWYQNVLNALSVTNVAPLILTGCSTRIQDRLIQLAHDSMHLPRKLILVGHSDIACRDPLRRVKTKLSPSDEEDLMLLPFEGIGANILKKYARGEPLDSVMEKRT